MSKEIRIGGPVFSKFKDPKSFVKDLQDLGFSATYDPMIKDDILLKETIHALKEADILIAETGAYGINVLEPKQDQRKSNILEICNLLERAEKIGSLCCVAHGGWVGSSRFNQHNPENFSESSVGKLISSVQEIIDTVQPEKTKFVLETESRYLPDSTEIYRYILSSVNRSAFGAHLDPVNITSSPRRFYQSGDFIRKCFSEIGSYLVSCHAKDIQMPRYVQVKFDESFAGNGGLDYNSYFSELAKLETDVPMMIEHVNSKQLVWAIDYLYGQAEIAGVNVKYGEKRISAL